MILGDICVTIVDNVAALTDFHWLRPRTSKLDRDMNMLRSKTQHAREICNENSTEASFVSYYIT